MLIGLTEPNKNARRTLWRAFFLSLVLHLTALLYLSEMGGSSGGRAFVSMQASSLPLDLVLANPAKVTPLLEAIVDVPASSAPESGTAEALPVANREQPSPIPSETMVARPDQLEEAGSSLYLPVDALSDPPVPLDVVELQLPTVPGPSLGKIVIEVQVNENGRVDKIRTIESNVPAPFLFEVFEAFSFAIYAPGRILGQPVKSRLRIEVSYALDQADRARPEVSIQKPAVAR